MEVTPVARACCLAVVMAASSSTGIAAPLSFELVEVDGVTTEHNSTGGASWVDVDGDGDLDLFVTNGYDVSAAEPAPQPNRLYLNDGRGGFTAVTAGALVETAGFSSGNTWGDYDNDGDLDVFITNQRDQDNLLFRNEGGGRFTRIEDEPPVMDGGHSYAASWVDVDNDGWLDLFVANGGMSHIGANGFYRGIGGGHFERITEGAVVADTTATGGFDWGDYDGDGDLDLFIANQGFNPAINANALYRNDGGWVFAKITDSPAVTEHFPSCAVHWVDIDNDQDLDLHVTNLYGLADNLYRNDGGALTPVAESPLSLDGGFGYEANWEDYDNDGDVDVAIGNWGSCTYLYLNDGRGGFERAHAGDLGARIHYAGTMASADFDGDGNVDIYVANWPNSPGEGELNRLYRNNGAKGRWLQIRLVGRSIGARVQVTADTGGGRVSQIRDIRPHVGFRGMSSMVPHFGLGTADAATVVEVRWPSGRVSRLENVKADRLVEVVEPAGD